MGLRAGGGDLALNTGDGVKKRLTLIDLFNAIKSGGFEGYVSITNIVCYAGGWAVEGEKLWTEKHPCVNKFREIAIFSACDEDSAIYISKYRKVFEAKIKGGDEAHSKYIIEKHSPRYGYAHYFSMSKNLEHIKSTLEYDEAKNKWIAKGTCVKNSVNIPE